MPVKPSSTAAKHSLLPTEPPKSDLVSNPPQNNMVDRKNSVLIHRIADWLESRYFSRNFLLAISSTPPYSEIAHRLSPAMAKINARTGFQSQPIHAKVGTERTRTACS